MFKRTTLISLLLFSASAYSGLAQATAGGGDTPQRTVSLFFARAGESLDAPHVGTMHFLEFVQVRNRWIYPDIGYIDFAHANYREMFIGGGRTLISKRRVSWEQELLYDEAMGTAAHNARYLQPWSMLRLRFTPKFANETVYFLYLPLNHSARVQHVIERSKFEYDVKKHWKIGAGYGATKFASSPWRNKPLLTTTFLTKGGEFEFWLQRVPGGAQVQLRYALIRASR